MPQCAFANCGERDDLVERLHEPTGQTYHYCGSHDPLDDDSTWQYTEADDA